MKNNIIRLRQNANICIALYISKLLEVLRKNTEDNARVNAALALVYLIREHDDMERVSHMTR